MGIWNVFFHFLFVSYRKGKKFLNYKRRESRNSYQFFSFHFLHVKFGSKCFKERKTNVKKFFF